MSRVLGGWIAVAVVAAMTAVASAQTTPPPAAPESKVVKPEEKAKTLLEEINFFAYVENSYVWNLRGAGRQDVNELRFYDFDTGYTFNMAEFSIKKDPSDRYPFGFGLVLTSGQDAQKNHAIGLFRSEQAVFPFEDTPHVDIQEAYLSYKIPVGTGLTIKAGKFVTLLGYEVIEGPNNLNFSRSFLFGFAIPLTHVGALASYAITDWLTVTAGPVLGWDVVDDPNDGVSWTGQIAMTPFAGVTTAFNFITGPEQFSKDHNRTVLDFVANYTGIKGLTLGFNVDWGVEENEASLRGGAGPGTNTDAEWWGVAAYAAYDWTEKFRTALRGEFFQDTNGVRTLAVGPNSKVELWEVTATAQYNIWKGLFSRVEYRHDMANEKVFRVGSSGAKNHSQDTLTLALHYLFF
jgi:hypothetical protein